MDKKYQVRLSGSGGQGLLVAGIILAEAAVHEGKNVVQSQSYGPEARGGASKSDVIISDGEINYPKATSIDLLLALTQKASEKYSAELKENGLLIVDSDLVTDLPKGNFRLYRLPIITSAKDVVGKLITANVVALGVLTAISGIVREESMVKAVMSKVPRGTEELNKKALHVGFTLGKENLS